MHKLFTQSTTMPACLMGEVKNPEAYEQYRAKVSALGARYHGECIARPGEIEVASGDWRLNRLIIIRFPDEASILAYFNDPVSDSLRELGQRAISQSVIVEGVRTAVGARTEKEAT